MPGSDCHWGELRLVLLAVRGSPRIRMETKVSPRFAYFYLMGDEPDRVRVTVPRHVSYWRGLGLTGYDGGPFVDRTGGLIMFDTDQLGDAQHAVAEDPFVKEGLLDEYWIKEWVPK